MFCFATLTYVVGTADCLVNPAFTRFKLSSTGSHAHVTRPIAVPMSCSSGPNDPPFEIVLLGIEWLADRPRPVMSAKAYSSLPALVSIDVRPVALP